MTIRKEVLDEFVEGRATAEDLFGGEGLLKNLGKALLERMLEGEMTTHLGYERYAAEGHGSGNSRNEYSEKTLKSEQGELTLEVPRDRAGTFEPVVAGKRETRLPSLNEKIIGLYARGMSTGDIQAHLEDLYGVELLPTLISNVTESVQEEVKLWQNRPLEAVYPILYLDALMVKNKAVYLALTVTLEGKKELLGLWLSQSEGAKFWLGILTELRQRGVKDILIVCVDGLNGFPEAFESVFPQTVVPLCIVHLVRRSLRFVNWKVRKTVAAALREIYTAAELALDAFAETWDATYPPISKLWRTHWERICPIFDFSPDIRRAIYTANAVESLNHSLRKVLKTKGVFPSDEAVLKLLFLALHNLMARWTMPIRDWKSALNHFAIHFDYRLPL